MKKKEWMAIAILLVFAVLSMGIIRWLRASNPNEKEVLVKFEGEIIKRLPFDEKTNAVFTFENSDEVNKIVIKNGLVVIEEATCRDQICVLHRPVSFNGETIVCLPHRLVVEIHSRTEPVLIDSIVE